MISCGLPVVEDMENLPEGLGDCYKTVKMDARKIPNYQWVGHVQEKSMHLKFIDLLVHLNINQSNK